MRWTIETNGKGESGKSVLVEQHDDVDLHTDTHIHTHTHTHTHI